MCVCALITHARYDARNYSNVDDDSDHIRAYDTNAYVVCYSVYVVGFI